MPEEFWCSSSLLPGGSRTSLDKAQALTLCQEWGLALSQNWEAKIAPYIVLALYKKGANSQLHKS